MIPVYTAAQGQRGQGCHPVPRRELHAAAVAVERALQARPVELRLVVVADLLTAAADLDG